MSLAGSELAERFYRAFLAERGEQRLDSHEVVVMAVQDDRVMRLFHYLHDPAAFEAFWSGA